MDEKHSTAATAVSGFNSPGRRATERGGECLAAQTAVSQILAASNDIQEAAPGILRVLCEHLRFSTGAYWTPSEQEWKLTCVEIWTKDRSRLASFAGVTRNQAFGAGEGLPGQVWSTGCPVWIETIGTGSAFLRAPAALAAGLCSGVAFPLRNSEECIGVMELFSESPRSMDAALLSTLDIIGSQIGQFVRRTQAEKALKERVAQLEVLFAMADAANRATSPEQLYDHALTALERLLGVKRASILVFDRHRTMRFTAWRGLSDEYRQAVDGHSPWTPDEPNAEPILVPDVLLESSLREYATTFTRENIRALAFFPLISSGRLRGKFMLYYPEPHVFSSQEIALANTIASYIGVAVHRKCNEAALQEGEERLRLSLEAGRIGVWEWDITGDRLIWSDRVYEIHGLAPGSLTGNPRDVIPLFHPDDLESVSGAVRNAIANSAPYTIEFRILRPGGEIRWISTNGRVIANAEGRPVRLLGTTLDITERKMAEESLIRQAADLARSNADLQQFAYVSSHDLREPLRTVTTYSQLLLEEYGPQLDSQAQVFLGYLSGAAKHMHALIEDLLSYSKVVNAEDDKFQLVDLGEVAAWAHRNLEASIIEANALVRCGELPVVRGNSIQLLQVFQNLISNAIKYRRGQPVVEVLAERTGEHWTFSVQDNGVGIEPAYHERIFGIFKRLHGKDIPGTGIGLALCKKIVEKHGGRIWVESVPGKGSTFRFTLSAAESSHP